MGNLNQAMLKGAKAYEGQRVAERNTLVVKYAPLVKRVALHLKTRLPSYVDANDLIQSGMVGLIDAIQNFKDGQGAAFETYAAIRIRGSIIDQLRQSDWTPRSVHQNTRAIRDALTRLSHELGRPPTDIEVAARLNVDINRYHQMLLESNSSQIMCIEDTGLTDDVIGDRPLNEISGTNPDDKLFESLNGLQFRDALAKSIESLPDRERTIVSFYYDQELNLREIGMIMGISESRTCQILAQALVRLRGDLEDWSSLPSEEIRKRGEVPPRKITKPQLPPVKLKSSLLFDESGEINDTPLIPGSKPAQLSHIKTATDDKPKAASTDRPLLDTIKDPATRRSKGAIGYDDDVLSALDDLESFEEMQNKELPEIAVAVEKPRKRGRPAGRARYEAIAEHTSADARSEKSRGDAVTRDVTADHTVSLSVRPDTSSSSGEAEAESSAQSADEEPVKAEKPRRGRPKSTTDSVRHRGRPSSKPVVMSMEEFAAMQQKQSTSSAK